jgi:hypothetical protein
MTERESHGGAADKIGRRAILKAASAVAAGAVLGLPGIAAAADRQGELADGTLVGAIRWDAWTGPDSSTGSSVNRTLSPDQYHFRLPFYADITVAERTLISAGFDDEAVGAQPAGWSVSASSGTAVMVEELPGREGRSVLLHDTSTTAAVAMSQTFAPQNRAVTVQWDWMETLAGRGEASLSSGTTVVVDLATRDESGTKQLVYRTTAGTWSVVQTITDATWYTVKVIADPAPPAGATPWVDIFVDGIRQVNHAPFLAATTALDTLTFQTLANMTADVHLDDVSVDITESVNIDGATQDLMDREIQYAQAAGIDYWAFVYYPQQPLSLGRELYLASDHSNDVNWCAVLDGNFTGNFTANLPELVARFGDANYQKVLGGRPLVYFLSAPTASWVNAMRSASAQGGWQDPYIVVMGWAAESAAAAKAAAGADAVSRYATGGQFGQPYADLASSESDLWPQYAQAADQVVPTVSTGWDKRPRYDYPVSWDADYTGFKDQWTQQATPQQIADHLQEAIDWCGTNSASTTANTVLIYAWNEFDEGGWICPTLSEIRDAGRPLRLDAISGVARGPQSVGGSRSPSR